MACCNSNGVCCGGRLISNNCVGGCSNCGCGYGCGHCGSCGCGSSNCGCGRCGCGCNPGEGTGCANNSVTII